MSKDLPLSGMESRRSNQDVEEGGSVLSNEMSSGRLV